MKNKQLEKIIRNSVDLHVHIGPEIIPRKYTVEELDKEESGKLYGVVLKNHFYPTSPLIKSTKARNIKLFGSVVLNNSVGGLNKEAVYASSLLLESPLMVWFPTINAEQFLKQSEYEVPPEWVGGSLEKSRKASLVNGLKVIDGNNKVNEKALEVLKIIKSTNSILATGHISWQESVALIEKAQGLGIKKIIVTHPIYQRIDMPVEIQKELANKGAFIEQCYSMYSIDKITIKKIASQIKVVSAKNCVLTSDVGQVFSPNPSEALKIFSKLLIQEGVTEKDLYIMLVKNPRKILGLSI